VNMLLWAGLAANALVQLRMAVLEVQDGEDRVQAKEATPNDVFCWQSDGIPYVVLRTIFSPVITTYSIGKSLLPAALGIGKFLLFPRGIKSKFAREQEAKAARELLEKQVRDAEVLVHTWVPGEILFAEHEPEQVALTWDHAADAFDVLCNHVARTAGQPWSPAAPTKTRIKAEVTA